MSKNEIFGTWGKTGQGRYALGIKCCVWKLNHFCPHFDLTLTSSRGWHNNECFHRILRPKWRLKSVISTLQQNFRMTIGGVLRWPSNHNRSLPAVNAEVRRVRNFLVYPLWEHQPVICMCALACNFLQVSVFTKEFTKEKEAQLVVTSNFGSQDKHRAQICTKIHAGAPPSWAVF